ncbi:MAG TPA: molybdopterin-binding protein [Pirellulaceae bacterium]|nr:molybdopterin-binding protein [Pirellulaceae bacterium]HMO92147.1 molybdopterin-binding protein [Pirellulaceae bacterium]HMP68928.1 molybdopterin-binding protein [Pirellulaceae bacterium]
MSKSDQKKITAEIISIGDELVSGQRLDTNSRWLSGRLNDLGIRVLRHCTVGDTMQEIVAVLSLAKSRADLVVCTGGLGPTADDLTRQACSELARVKLMLDESSLVAIKSLFDARGRVMPDSNRIQAFFPDGAIILPNNNGTAPGFALTIAADSPLVQRPSMVIALPGVPAELFEMWEQNARPLLIDTYGIQATIFHHSIHCFGKGESEVEALLPNLIARDREPLVGITASQATISLRIQAHADSHESFMTEIAPTLNEINQALGNLIFGVNNQRLEDVIVELFIEQQINLAVVDIGHVGQVAYWLSCAGANREILRAALQVHDFRQLPATLRAAALNNSPDVNLRQIATEIANHFDTQIGAAYSVQLIDNDIRKGSFEIALAVFDRRNGSTFFEQFTSGSHPSIRDDRIAKWILNQLRLWLST